ncbi:hypothetical protein [Demequina sediminis]|uniref:hypothetical protein n=1 Tax=Demequina sediminis TaxID=1930058 RepID=UPI0025746D58|nr:hypothetical protein [Demequina sediminis]
MTNTTTTVHTPLLALPAFRNGDGLARIRVRFTTSELRWLRANALASANALTAALSESAINADEVLERLRLASEARAIVRAALSVHGRSRSGDVFRPFSDEAPRIAHARRRLLDMDMEPAMRARVEGVLSTVLASPESQRLDEAIYVGASHDAHNAIAAVAEDARIPASRLVRLLLAERFHATHNDCPLPLLGDNNSHARGERGGRTVMTLVAVCMNALHDAGVDTSEMGDVITREPVDVPPLAGFRG